MAISTNSIIEYVTDNLLLEQGLKPEEIKKEAIPKIPVRYDLLMKDKMKQRVSRTPWPSWLKAEGEKIIDTSSNLSQTVIYFRNDYLDKNSGNVTKLLKAYARAAAEINQNPENYWSLLVEKGVPQEALGVFRMDHYPAPRLPEKERVERVVQWMLEKNLLKQNFTYEDLTRPGLLPQD